MFFGCASWYSQETTYCQFPKKNRHSHPLTFNIALIKVDSNWVYWSTTISQLGSGKESLWEPSSDSYTDILSIPSCIQLIYGCSSNLGQTKNIKKSWVSPSKVTKTLDLGLPYLFKDIGWSPWWYPNSWMVYFMGNPWKKIRKMDDWGYPRYPYGNLDPMAPPRHSAFVGTPPSWPPVATQPACHWRAARQASRAGRRHWTVTQSAGNASWGPGLMGYPLVISYSLHWKWPI